VTQWAAFLKKGRLDIGGAGLVDVCAFLASFLMPPALSLIDGAEFDRNWPAGGPWKDGP
jgi:hypothetical protein